MALKDALVNTRGWGIRQRFRHLRYELLYAWQRAWRGFSDEDVFALHSTFQERMLSILKEFRRTNIGEWYDSEKGRFLNSDEMDNLLDDLIMKFERLCEDFVDDEILGDLTIDEKAEELGVDVRTLLKRLGDRREQYKNEAFEALSKWFYNLWI